ncbi:MAG: hypothetical protein AAF468_19550 [Pseudomonadota bacterium]
MRNGLGVSISKLALELGFFNKDELLERLSSLDFRDAPKGKSRVRQFSLADVRCDALKRILINDVALWEGPGRTACLGALKPLNRTTIEFSG